MRILLAPDASVVVRAAVHVRRGCRCGWYTALADCPANSWISRRLYGQGDSPSASRHLVLSDDAKSPRHPPTFLKVSAFIDNRTVPTISFTDAFSQLHHCIDPYISSAQMILEAGGGSWSHINTPASAQITVVDISPEQLEMHQTAHHKILGDLHVVDFGTSSCDVAIIWNVIEHLENPALVLDKLRDALRPNGVIIIAAPHPASLQAMVTKWTPHWVHVFILRHAFKNMAAGLPGFPPFETVHHSDIDPQKLTAWAHESGLEILFYTAYESTRRAALQKKSPVIAFFWGMTISLGNKFRSSALEASDYFLVVRKPG
jgi:SAM-dependent methyltransferase